MQDLKYLYLEAKRTGSQKSIDAYMEAINDFISNNPAGYISNLEYIISSSSGLQTLHEFVEKNGMPLTCVDTLEACLEKCIEKCEATEKDPSEYKKVLESVQNARVVYDESFAMFEYYKENLPENYVETYYGKNSNGIPNRKLIAGMIERFGEACIPDMLQVADAIGESALRTAIGYIHDHHLHEKNDRILNQWVFEAAKTTHLYRISNDDFRGVFDQLYENTLSEIIGKMHDRKDKLYRESVIMGDDSLMMEYSEDEIKAIEDMISFKEYQMVATPAPHRAKIFQEETCSLYEELDGLVVDAEQEFTEKQDARKAAAAKIAANMKSLATKIKKAVGPAVHKAIYDANYGKGVFDNGRLVMPSVRVTFGDKKGPFTFGKLGIKKKINKNLDEIVDFSSEWIKGIAIFIELTTETGAPLSKSIAEKYWKVFAKAVETALKDLIKDGIVSLTGAEPDNYTYVTYVTSFRIPVFMSKSNIIEDVDLDFSESSEEFLEMIADSVLPMLPGDGHDIMEAQWQWNTLNKKTGGIPGYLSNNHNLGYGEDEPPKEKKPEEDYDLNDFKRPSASGDSTPAVTPEPEVEDEPDPEKTDKPQNGVSNYYYYTYNNSLNRNQNSFNRTRHDIKDDHSTHTAQDDHSTGKRVNSDDVDSHNFNTQKDKKKDPEVIEDNEDEEDQKDETPIDEEPVTEAVGDADTDKPQSDHPVKDVLTDVDRALTKKQQQAKKVVQDAQNVGRAFVKPVQRTSQWITAMVSKWKDVDENNVKERMADPHARKNIFTAIGDAIKYGSLLKAGILLNPVFLFLSVTKGVGRHKKEFRIRNEMIGELKTELEVIDEKIKDADRAGDNKAKYQLMRLKNEINKKLVRVGGDKQWKKIL